MATQTKKTKISSQAVMGEIKTLAMLTGGVVIGSLGGKMIDKVLNVDATATGFNAKALARPIVLLGVGTAGNLMLKVFLKKDLLAGLSDFSFNGIDGLGEPTVYREPMNLSVERYNPDLPALSSPTSYNPEEFSSHSAMVEGVAEEDLAYIEII
jgi:hypothetical protein